MNLYNQYGIPFKKINDLTDIKLLLSLGWLKFCFEYKGVEFLYSHHSIRSETAVVFHAAVSPDVTLPVFRGFDWELRNKNILCISDYVLKKYRKYNKSKISFDATFYLETDLFPVDSIYFEVISFFKEINSSEIITFGTSAGGLAALRYASHFKSTALVGNAEFYLSKWWNFKNTSDVIASQNDKIKNIDIESFLEEIGPPKKLFLFTNVFDEMTYQQHHLPIIGFFEKNYPKNLEVIRHCEKHTGKFHTSHFPKNTPHKNLLSSLSTSSRAVCVFTDDVSWCKKEFLLKSQKVKEYFEATSSKVDSFVKDKVLPDENPLLIGVFKNKENASKALVDFPLFFDWLLIFKDADKRNQPKSKHGVFSASLPINDELWSSNDFHVFS